MKIKEGKLNEWTQKMKEWDQKMKEWTMKYYQLRKNDIDYVILSPSTKVIEEPIRAPCARST